MFELELYFHYANDDDDNLCCFILYTTYILNELICPIAIYKAWFYRQCFFYQGWLAENHAGTFIVFGCLFDLMAKKCRSFFGHFQ